MLIEILLTFVVFQKVQNQEDSKPVACFLRPTEQTDGLSYVLQFAEQFFGDQVIYPPSRLYQDLLTQPPNNTYGIWERVCSRLSVTGAVCMLGTGDSASFDSYDSLASAHHVPFVNWAQSSREQAGSVYSVSLKPPIDQLIADVIIDKQWKHVTYLHEGLDATFNLQNIFMRLRERMPNVADQVFVEMLELPPDDRRYAKFLYDFHRDRFNESEREAFHVVVDVSSSDKLESVMNALHGNSLQSPDRFHYLFADFGLTPRDMERIERGFLNMTVLQLVRRDTPFFESVSKEYRRFTRQRDYPDDSDFPADLALAFDAVLVVHNALKIVAESHVSEFNKLINRSIGALVNRGHPGILCRKMESQNAYPGEKPLYETFSLGDVISDAIRKIQIDEDKSLTGFIKFSESGLREGFQVEVIDYGFDELSAASNIKTCMWQEGIGLIQAPPLPDLDFALIFNLTGDPTMRIITTVITAPHMMRKPGMEFDESQPLPNEAWEGFCATLIEMVAKRIGFTYRIKIVSDGNYGNVKEDGSWDGMIGELLNEDAHIAVAPLTISRQRERVVDFSKPFMVTGITIMIKKPDKAEFSVFAFMHPLSQQIWTFICMAYIGVSLVIFLVSRFSPYEWRVDENANGSVNVCNDFSIYNCLWFTLAALMHQGTDILPRSVSGRIASSAWWFFTMIMLASYSANLAALLTSEKLAASIDSVDRLAEQTRIKYGIQGGGSTQAFFQHSSVPMYRKMWSFMESQNTTQHVLTRTYSEGIAKVRESKGMYAFLLEGTANEYANTRKPCDTMKVGDPLNSVGYGVATPFGSDLRQPINLAILELQEKGALKKLEINWWYDRGQCEQGISAASQTVSLNLSKVAGIFYILIVGMIIAMVTALLELYYRGDFDKTVHAHNFHVMDGASESHREARDELLYSTDHSEADLIEEKREMHERGTKYNTAV